MLIQGVQGGGGSDVGVSELSRYGDNGDRILECASSCTFIDYQMLLKTRTNVYFV